MPSLFDSAAARAYGVITLPSPQEGRKARGTRAVDLLIAAVAAASGLPSSRNPQGFVGLEDFVAVVAV